jgi:hypothetical protein
MRREIDRMISILQAPEDYVGAQLNDRNAYQVYLLGDGGYINHTSVDTLDYSIVMDIELTQKGNDFVTLLGDKQVYDAVDRRLKEKGFNIREMNFDIIERLAKEEVE